MSEHILFLTGRLAELQLRRVLTEMGDAGFTWDVQVPGVQVAALLTGDMIRRRLTDTQGADRILLPGRCRGDLAALSEHFGIPVERGPDELMDLPAFFGRQRRAPICRATMSSCSPNWSMHRVCVSRPYWLRLPAMLAMAPT